MYFESDTVKKDCPMHILGNLDRWKQGSVIVVKLNLCSIFFCSVHCMREQDYNRDHTCFFMH